MTTATFTPVAHRFVWKEYRMLRGFWLAVAGLAIAQQCVSTLLAAPGSNLPAWLFGSALAGRCKDRAELVETPIPLAARLDVLPVRGGEELLQRIFEPLGYAIAAQRHPLDEQFPEWGDSPLFTVNLEQTTTLSALLQHLYVLIPVFDLRKHYYIGQDEVEKLFSKAGGWLADHPERELIARRYLVPQQVDANGLHDGQVEITDEALRRVIERYTREAGVRNLERQIGSLCRKAANC